jgi:hypothetical protein
VFIGYMMSSASAAFNLITVFWDRTDVEIHALRGTIVFEPFVVGFAHLSILSRIGAQVRSTFVALRAWQPSFCLRHRIEMKPSRLIFATTALHLHNASRPFTGAGVADMHQLTTHAARRLFQ